MSAQQVSQIALKRQTHSFHHWIFDKPWHIERLGMIVQRATGVGLLLYLVFHLVVTSTILGGKDFFTGVMDSLTSPLAHIGEIVVIGAVGFHGINGIRVALIGLGVISGRPHRPDFPYKMPSLNNAEKGAMWTAFATGVLSLLVGTFFILIAG